MNNIHVTIHKKQNGYVVSDNRNYVTNEMVFIDSKEMITHVAKQLGLFKVGEDLSCLLEPKIPSAGSALKKNDVRVCEYEGCNSVNTMPHYRLLYKNGKMVTRYSLFLCPEHRELLCKSDPLEDISYGM